MDGQAGKRYLSKVARLALAEAGIGRFGVGYI